MTIHRQPMRFVATMDQERGEIVDDALETGRTSEPGDRKAAIMVSIQEKSKRLAEAHRKLDQFITTGKDLKAPEVVSIRVEFENAFKELYGEFGPAPQNPYIKRGIIFI